MDHPVGVPMNDYMFALKDLAVWRVGVARRNSALRGDPNKNQMALETTRRKRLEKMSGHSNGMTVGRLDCNLG
jgi:hypothetical protein